MKRLRNIFITVFIVLSLSVCEGCRTNKIQGVVESDSGEVAVTFTVPEGMDVEDVLGSDIGEENPMNITSIANSGTSNEGFCYWYTVADGGILCRKGDVYRYSPTAEAIRVAGALSPPAWVMLTSSPSNDELFSQEDSQKLEEKYEIKLNFSSK